jgi:bifunctional DNA-binding transcriptional regulator/antitoxin component of YhaV-PrlF toxin-antitoxin module
MDLRAVRRFCEGCQAEGNQVMRTFLDDAGRIELPDRVQSQLGVKAGDLLAWEEEGGRWFLEPADSRTAPSNQAAVAPGVSPGVSPGERGAATAAGESDDDELHWEDLDYEPLSLRRVGQVRFRIRRRGKLQPAPYNLDEE